MLLPTINRLLILVSTFLLARGQNISLTIYGHVRGFFGGRVDKLAFSIFVSFIFVSFPASADSFPSDKGTIEITPLIHSSVQLEYDGLVIQVDPWGIIGLENAKPADLILVTDNPDHHLDPQAIATLRKPDTVVIIAANGKEAIPDGHVLANGESIEVAGVTIMAVAAYDIIPGPPAHPKGDANGYVLTLGSKKLFFAGVTECVEEIKALQGIDIAFMPMNIPPGRMTPAAAAECTRLLNPTVTYLYHYDQGWARRLSDPDSTGPELPGGITVDDSLLLFNQELEGSGIEVRMGNWYPSLD